MSTKSKLVQFSLLAVMAALTVWFLSRHTITIRASSAAIDIVFAQDNTTLRWKKTKYGWMDSADWDRPQPVEFERRIELFHPLAFSALMILVSTGLLIWATEERQWAHALNRKRKK